MRLATHTNIKPELIDCGDTIRAEYPADKGVTMIKQGTVSEIHYHGGMRYFVTDENQTIALYSPHQNVGIKFTLINRPAKPETMLDMFEAMGRL